MTERITRILWRKAGFVALLGPALALCSCVAVTQLNGESSPPGYISGNIPHDYSGQKDPFSLQDQQAPSAGQALYKQSCANCHGDNGLGDGPKSDYLEPRPANFGAPPVLTAFRDHQDYVFWWVSEGVPQTAMPAWRDRLSAQERWQVITYAWSLGEKAAH